MKKIIIIAIILLNLVAFLSCAGDKKLTLNASFVELYAHDKHTITTNGSNVSFSSENPYIATVNSTTGVVTAMTIGKTSIKVTSDQGDAEVLVNVNQKYNTYVEPCTDFSKTKSQIISMYGNPDVSDSGGIAYVYDDKKHFGDMYFFSNSKLYASTAIINQDYAVELMNFLGERYWAIGSEDGQYVFANGSSIETITMGVVMSKMSGYKLYSVTYMPYTDDTRSIYEEFNVQQIVNSLDKEWLKQYKL